MRDLWRSLLMIAAVLLVPIVPFLLWGEHLEQLVRDWSERPKSQLMTAGLVVATLGTDVFLPIPSSFVSTLAGARLGTVLATGASWTGMTLGASLGFAIARTWGRPLAAWFSSADELNQMQQLSDRLGPSVLVFTRALPVLAEAAVLLAGVHQLTWRRFLPPVVLSNLGIAWAYSAFGSFAEQNQWIAPALGISIALPLILMAAARRWWSA